MNSVLPNRSHTAAATATNNHCHHQSPSPLTNYHDDLIP
jgi:hypothetical protein